MVYSVWTQEICAVYRAGLGEGSVAAQIRTDVTPGPGVQAEVIVPSGTNLGAAVLTRPNGDRLQLANSGVPVGGGGVLFTAGQPN